MTDSYYERFWDRIGTVRGEHWGVKPHQWAAYRDFIPRTEGIVIVDYGCGVGQYIRKMKEINPTATYIGLDISRNVLDQASARLTDVIFKEVTDGKPIPLEDNSVDFVLASEVIEHIYDTESTFRELNRILKPGGRLFLTTPYHGLIKNLLIAVAAFDTHFDPEGPHVRFYTKKTLLACMKKYGFRPIEHRFIGRFYPIPWSICVLAEKLEAADD